MPNVLAGLLTALCLKVDFSANRQSRPWKNVKRLLSHEYLKNVCGVTGARHVFEELETLLAREPHYWLQRSCLEIECGDAQQGELFVNQAYGLAPNDAFVRVERAYAWLKKAISAPHAVGADERVRNALDELQDLIQARGRFDSYPYHVIGSQVLAWTRVAGLAPVNRLSLLALAEQEVTNGLKIHPRNRDLQTLQQDLVRERVAVAVGLS